MYIIYIMTKVICAHTDSAKCNFGETDIVLRNVSNIFSTKTPRVPISFGRRTTFSNTIDYVFEWNIQIQSRCQWSYPYSPVMKDGGNSWVISNIFLCLKSVCVSWFDIVHPQKSLPTWYILADFPAVFFIFADLIFGMKHNWQIQIQNHENKSQLSRAIN